MQKLVIDADPGIGDAIAITVALLDPELDVIGLTATGGCVSGQQAGRNLQALVETLDPPKWPRIGCSEAGATRVRGAYAAEVTDLKQLHGESGLGDWQVPVADLHHPRESSKLLVELVRMYPQEVTLLTLGPLTNVELAFEKAPDFFQLLKGLVCLGGAVEAPGDVSPVAEFNIYSDPEAAQFVLRSPATKTLVPLDVSRQLVFGFEHYDRLPTDPTTGLGRVLSSLLPFALRSHHQHLGLEGLRLSEVVALAFVARPDLFTRGAMAIDVETEGNLTRGMTVFDRRGIPKWRNNIDVLRQVEAQGVLDYMTDVIKRGG